MQHQRGPAPAAAARIMNHLGARLIDNALACGTQAPAQIDVLVIEEISLVESAHGAEALALEQHEHARDPVRFDGAPVDGVIGSAGFTQQLSEQGRDGGETARTVLEPAVRIAHQRTGYRARVSRQRLQQRGKRVGGEADIGIANAEVGCAATAEGRVVIGAEALRLRVHHDLHVVAGFDWLERDGIPDVFGQDQMQAGSVNATRVPVQGIEQRVLAVAYHRQGDQWRWQRLGHALGVTEPHRPRGR